MKVPVLRKLSSGIISKGSGNHNRDYIKSPLTPGELKTLHRWAIPKGKLLNPHGRGAKHHEVPDNALRKRAMLRNRLKLAKAKAVALEHHELQQLARENATLAMQTLIEISRNPRAPEATRIAASAVILDRGYGKASQTTITANVGNGKNNQLTGDELDKRVDKALKRVEELTNRTRKAPPSPNGSPDLRKLN